jgi:hypothetical protein
MQTLEIEKMNTTERLQAMEVLWDALIHEKYEIKSPAWHHDILKERKEKIAEGKGEFLSLKELKARHNR